MLPKDGLRIINLNLLKSWFLQVKRPFPWREKTTPYAVLVSEIMLQQTVADVVVPYYKKWMEAMPTVEILSKTPLERVLKLWEGLGYYSRAKNLHKASQEIMTRFNGEVPSTYEELISIKGIGPYTAGAILSFAFKQRAVAVDGNVQRVLTRLFALRDDLSHSKTVPKLQRLLEEHLPQETPWIVSEALIELGATVCKKKPACSLCPLRIKCLAYKSNIQLELPIKTKKQKVEVLKRGVAVIMMKDHFLVKKQPEGQIMGGLYEFFYQDSNIDLETTLTQRNFKIREKKELPEEKHTFTRYRVHLYPTLFKVDSMSPLTDYEWVDEKRLKTLPFSSGHRRILKHLN